MVGEGVATFTHYGFQELALDGAPYGALSEETWLIALSMCAPITLLCLMSPYDAFGFYTARGRAAITSIAVPPDGALWVGTERSGVWRYSPPK